MKMGKALLLSAALMVSMSAAAYAFQEQQGAAPPASAPKGAPAAVEGQSGNIEFSTPSAGTGASAGTEVRIPGLGRLGVLPKMDFGLELLYGAASEPKVQDTRPDGADDDSLRIRGTVKHRF